MMKGSKLILAAAAGIIMLAACQKGVVYDSYASTPLAGWEKNDTLTFTVPPVDSTATYASQIGLRTPEAYPFTAITLIVEQHIYPSDSTVTDTVNCQLIDRHGNASGKGIGYHQYTFPVGELGLQKGDSIYVRIRHDMKREILPGISDVGLTLKR